MACQNNKTAGVMQTVNSADGVLEAKNAQVTDESANSERPKKQKKGEPSEQSHDRSDSIQQHVPHLSWFEGKNLICLIESARSRFQNCACHCSEKHCFENM